MSDNKLFNVWKWSSEDSYEAYRRNFAINDYVLQGYRKDFRHSLEDLTKDKIIEEINKDDSDTQKVDAFKRSYEDELELEEYFPDALTKGESYAPKSIEKQLRYNEENQKKKEAYDKAPKHWLQQFAYIPAKIVKDIVNSMDWDLVESYLVSANQAMYDAKAHQYTYGQYEQIEKDKAAMETVSKKLFETGFQNILSTIMEQRKYERENDLVPDDPSFIYEVASGTGYTTALMAVNMIPFVGTPLSIALGMQIEGAGASVDAYNDALSKGRTKEEAMDIAQDYYNIMSTVGATEILGFRQGKIALKNLGKIFKRLGKEIATEKGIDLTSKLARRELYKDFGRGLVKNMAEETLQETFTDATNQSMNLAYGFQAAWDVDRTLNTIAVTLASSALMGAGTQGLQTNQLLKVSNEIKNHLGSVDNLVEKKIISKEEAETFKQNVFKATETGEMTDVVGAMHLNNKLAGVRVAEIKNFVKNIYSPATNQLISLLTGKKFGEGELAKINDRRQAEFDKLKKEYDPLFESLDKAKKNNEITQEEYDEKEKKYSNEIVYSKEKIAKKYADIENTAGENLEPNHEMMHTLLPIRKKEFEEADIKLNPLSEYLLSLELLHNTSHFFKDTKTAEEYNEVFGTILNEIEKTEEFKKVYNAAKSSLIPDYDKVIKEIEKERDERIAALPENEEDRDATAKTIEKIYESKIEHWKKEKANSANNPYLNEGTLRKEIHSHLIAGTSQKLTKIPTNIGLYVNELFKIEHYKDIISPVAVLSMTGKETVVTPEEVAEVESKLASLTQSEEEVYYQEVPKLSDIAKMKDIRKIYEALYKVPTAKLTAYINGFNKKTGGNYHLLNRVIDVVNRRTEHKYIYSIKYSDEKQANIITKVRKTPNIVSPEKLEAMQANKEAVEDRLKGVGIKTNEMMWLTDVLPKLQDGMLKDNIISLVEHLGGGNTVALIFEENLHTGKEAQYSGMFDSETNTIHIYTNRVIAQEYNPKIADYVIGINLIHETTHAITANMIGVYDVEMKNGQLSENLTEEQRTIIKELYKIYDRVKIREELKGEYGLEDLHEFLSELTSNTEFTKKLSALGKRNATLVERAIELYKKLVATLLGKPIQKEDSLGGEKELERATLLTSALLNTYNPIQNEKLISEWESNPLANIMTSPFEVKYTLKSIQLLSTDKAKELFKKGQKNKWTLEEILTKLGIPKEQKQLILNTGLQDREQIAIELASKYSYAIEINISKEKLEDYEMVDITGEGDFELVEFEPDTDLILEEDEDGNVIDTKEVLSEKGKKQIEEREKNRKPTQHYSHLSARNFYNESKYEGNPDWEYQELAIQTPLIENISNAHTEDFSQGLPNMLGWVRVWYNKKTGAVEIQEVQSDLFQKNRDREDLAKRKPLEATVLTKNEFETVVKGLEPYKVTGEEVYYLIGNQVYIEVLDTEISDQYYTYSTSETSSVDSANSFLQLLNKGGNWVTFFIKSIMQDSAKKGYKKVSFPKGETAAKVEGHETIAEEINRINTAIERKKNEISEIKEAKVEFNINEINQNFIYEGIGKEGKARRNGLGEMEYLERRIDTNRIPTEIWRKSTESEYKTIYTNHVKRDNNRLLETRNNELLKLEQQKQELKSQGVEKLKPIEAFYGIKIDNILKKQYGKDKVNTTTDEFGNEWNEIEIEQERDTAEIYLQETIKSNFQGFKGGFEDKGKGTPEGDGKDKAMRAVADAFIGEVANKNSSSMTSAKQFGAGNIDENTFANDFENEEYSTVMLARNKEFSGKPLQESTKGEILLAHESGAEFVVGDMPNVDSQFIDYLNEIGAKYTIYHTGDTPRIQPIQTINQEEKVSPQGSNEAVEVLFKEKVNKLIEEAETILYNMPGRSNWTVGFHGGRLFDKPSRDKQYSGEFRDPDMRRIAESFGARYEGYMLFFDAKSEFGFKDAAYSALQYAMKYGDDNPTLYAYLIKKDIADYTNRGEGEVGVSYDNMETNDILKLGQVTFNRDKQKQPLQAHSNAVVEQSVAPNKPFFSIEKAKSQSTFRKKPLEFVDKIPTERDYIIGASNRNGKILLNEKALLEKYNNKSWSKESPKLGDGSKATPLAENEFTSFEEFFTFVLLHELKHDTIKINKGETRGQYEDRINKAALEDLRRNYQQKIQSESKVALSKNEKTNEVLTQFQKNGAVDEELSPIVDFLVAQNSDLEVQTVESDFVIKTDNYAPIPIGNRAGIYYRKGNTKRIYLNTTMSNGMSLSAYRTLAHELLHAYVNKEIDNQLELANGLRKLYKDVKSGVLEDSEFYQKYKADLDRLFNQKEENNRDLKEFVAYVMSNTSVLRDYMKMHNVTTEGQSYNSFRRFFQMVKAFVVKNAKTPTQLQALESLLYNYTKLPVSLESQVKIEDSITIEEKNYINDMAEKAIAGLSDELLQDMRGMQVISSLIKDEWGIADIHSYLRTATLSEFKERISNTPAIINMIESFYSLRLAGKNFELRDYVNAVASYIYNLSVNSTDRRVANINLHTRKITYYTGTYKDHQGNTKNTRKPNTLLDSMIPILENLLGTRLEVVYIDSMTIGTGADGKEVTKNATDVILNNNWGIGNIETMKILQSMGLIYTGTWADKSTVIALKPSGTVNVQKLDSIKNMYIEKIKALVESEVVEKNYFEGISSLTYPNIIRAIIEDIKLGGIVNGTGENAELITALFNPEKNDTYDLIKIFKRPYVVSSMSKCNPEGLAEYANIIIEQVYGGDAKQSGINVREDGTISFNAYIFDASSTKEVPFEYDGKTYDIKDILVNAFGTETTDGAFIYGIGGIDAIWRKGVGTLKEGALKLWGHNNLEGEFSKPFYLKTAGHGFSQKDMIVQWMRKNGIALLISSSSVKVNSYGAGDFDTINPESFIELPLNNLERIMEKDEHQMTARGLKQSLASNLMVPENSALSAADPEGEILPILQKFIDNLVAEYERKLSNISSVDLLEKIKKVCSTPTNNRERMMSNLFLDLLYSRADEVLQNHRSELTEAERIGAFELQEHIKEVREIVKNDKKRVSAVNEALADKVGKIFFHPYFNSIFESYLHNILKDAILYEVTGTYSVLMPDIGVLATTRYEKVKSSLKALAKQTAMQNPDYAEIEVLEKALKGNLAEEERKDLEEALNELKDELKKETDETYNEYLRDVLDEKTGRIKSGYSIITKDIAERFNIHIGEPIVTIAVPSDSMQAMDGTKVVAILDATQAPVNCLSLNSEYIQSQVGKDFDLDTLFILPYSDLFSIEDYYRFAEILHDTNKEYIPMMQRTYSKILEMPIEKEQLFDKEIKAKFLQKIYGAKKSKAKYNPLADQFMLDKYQKMIGNIIGRRTLVTIKAALGFKAKFEFPVGTHKDNTKIFRADINFVDNDYLMLAHVIHLAETNAQVDIPSDDTALKYDSTNTIKQFFVDNNLMGLYTDIKRHIGNHILPEEHGTVWGRLANYIKQINKADDNYFGKIRQVLSENAIGFDTLRTLKESIAYIQAQKNAIKRIRGKKEKLDAYTASIELTKEDDNYIPLYTLNSLKLDRFPNLNIGIEQIANINDAAIIAMKKYMPFAGLILENVRQEHREHLKKFRDDVNAYLINALFLATQHNRRLHLLKGAILKILNVGKFTPFDNFKDRDLLTWREGLQIAVEPYVFGRVLKKAFEQPTLQFCQVKNRKYTLNGITFTFPQESTGKINIEFTTSEGYKFSIMHDQLLNNNTFAGKELRAKLFGIDSSSTFGEGKASARASLTEILDFTNSLNLDKRFEIVKDIMDKSYDKYSSEDKYALFLSLSGIAKLNKNKDIGSNEDVKRMTITNNYANNNSLFNILDMANDEISKRFLKDYVNAFSLSCPNGFNTVLQTTYHLQNEGSIDEEIYSMMGLGESDTSPETITNLSIKYSQEEGLKTVQEPFPIFENEVGAVYLSPSQVSQMVSVIPSANLVVNPVDQFMSGAMSIFDQIEKISGEFKFTIARINNHKSKLLSKGNFEKESPTKYLEEIALDKEIFDLVENNRVDEKGQDDNIVHDNSYGLEDMQRQMTLLKNKGHFLDNANIKPEKTKIVQKAVVSGREVVVVDYSNGEKVIFYKSLAGTDGKVQGEWYPIPGWSSKAMGNLPKGWFIKENNITEHYGSKVFKETSEWLKTQNFSVSDTNTGTNIRFKITTTENGLVYNFEVNGIQYSVPESQFESTLIQSGMDSNTATKHVIAAEYHKIYSVKNINTVNSVIAYLKELNSNPKVKTQFAILNEMIAKYERMLGALSNKSRLFQYMPHIITEEKFQNEVKALLKVREIKRLKEDRKEKIELIGKGIYTYPKAYHQIANMTDEEIYKLAKENVEKQVAGYGLAGMGDFVNASMLARHFSSEDLNSIDALDKSDRIHGIHHSSFLNNIKNDLMYANYLVFEGFYFDANSEDSYIRRAILNHTAEMTGNKVLNSKPIDLNKLNRGMQISFYYLKNGRRMMYSGIIKSTDENFVYLEVDAKQYEKYINEQLADAMRINQRIASDERKVDVWQTAKQKAIINDLAEQGYIKLLEANKDRSMAAASDLIYKTLQSILADRDNWGRFRKSQMQREVRLKDRKFVSGAYRYMPYVQGKSISSGLYYLQAIARELDNSYDKKLSIDGWSNIFKSGKALAYIKYRLLTIGGAIEYGSKAFGLIGLSTPAGGTHNYLQGTTAIMRDAGFRKFFLTAKDVISVSRIVKEAKEKNNVEHYVDIANSYFAKVKEGKTPNLSLQETTDLVAGISLKHMLNSGVLFEDFLINSILGQEESDDLKGIRYNLSSRAKILRKKLIDSVGYADYRKKKAELYTKLMNATTEIEARNINTLIREHKDAWAKKKAKMLETGKDFLGTIFTPEEIEEIKQININLSEEQDKSKGQVYATAAGEVWNSAFINYILKSGTFKRFEGHLRRNGTIFYVFNELNNKETDEDTIFRNTTKGIARTQAMYTELHRRLGDRSKIGKFFYMFGQYPMFSLQNYKMMKRQMRESTDENEKKAIKSKLKREFAIDVMYGGANSLLMGLKLGHPVNILAYNAIIFALNALGHAIDDDPESKESFWEKLMKDFNTREFFFSLLSFKFGMGHTFFLNTIYNSLMGINNNIISLGRMGNLFTILSRGTQTVYEAITGNKSEVNKWQDKKDLRTTEKFLIPFSLLNPIGYVKGDIDYYNFSKKPLAERIVQMGEMAIPFYTGIKYQTNLPIYGSSTTREYNEMKKEKQKVDKEKNRREQYEEDKKNYGEEIAKWRYNNSKESSKEYEKKKAEDIKNGIRNKDGELTPKGIAIKRKEYQEKMDKEKSKTNRIIPNVRWYQ